MFVERLVESGRPKIIRKYRFVLAKNKAGYIMPMNLYTNYCWNF